MAVVVMAGVALGALAWRLSQGPLELQWLTHRLEQAANGGPATLSIGGASLAWEGFRSGTDQPLDIRLADVAVSEAGRRLATLPRVEVFLSLLGLMEGRLVPRSVEIDGARLHLRRAADGALQLDLGTLGEQADTAPPEGTASNGFELGPALRELGRPAAGDSAARRSVFSQVRRVRIHDAAITVDDRQLGAVWQAPSIELLLHRREAGGIEGGGAVTLALGDQRTELTVSLVQPPSGGFAVNGRLTPLVPAAWATQAPPLAPLAALDAPLTLAASAELGPDFGLHHAHADIALGAGTIHAGTGSMPVVAAEAELDGNPARFSARVIRFETAPRPDGPLTTIQGSAQISRAGGQIAAQIEVALDQASFADLPALWPEGVGGPGTRPWITANVTAGIARNARVQVSLTAPEDFSDATVTSVAGGLDGEDLTVHWLRPVPPMIHANGHLTLLDPDTLEVDITSARQAGGRITAQAGVVRIRGIAGHDQFATIAGDLAGPVPDLLAVLSHPKVRLLDRRPIPMKDPSGHIEGHLAIAELPLRDSISLDDLHIRATGKLSDLHLGAIAAGRDLDRGALSFAASNDGLSVDGTADLATIPSRLKAEMDFRDGPPTQVLEKVSVAGVADAGQLAAAGLDVTTVMSGRAGLDVLFQTRRSGRNDLALKADLAQARLSVAKLDFTKPVGAPADLTAKLLLDRDRMTALDPVVLEGDGITLRGSLGFADGRPAVVQIARLALGSGPAPDTDAQGEIRVPARAGDPWVVRLSGRSLDASAQFARRNEQLAHPQPASDQPADQVTPYRAELRFDRVLVANGAAVQAVQASADSDGQIIRNARLAGRTGPDAPFMLGITPDGRGRNLTGSAADAGALMRGLGIASDMRGGRLAVRGRYDDTRADHLLTGDATIDDFRMVNTPGLARLLQAMTLYGLVELLRGPGLGFDRVVGPFSLAGDVLQLRDARAFNSALGMTAKGWLDLKAQTMDMQGTVVPAYFFNTLLGRIPLVGRLFSPEQGGGVFAATYSVRGSINDPSVSVNPLAALTPGFLRGLFGIFDQGSKPPK